MRKILAAVAIAALSGAAPAPAAGPAVHTALLSGSVYDVSVTCDTSSYPAPNYRCDLDIEVTSGCSEVTGLPLVTDCVLAIHGKLRAIPSPNPVGRCTIVNSGDGVITTFDSGADPSFHVERRDIVQVVWEAGAYVINGEVNTGFTVVVAAPYVIADILPDPMVGALVTPVKFTDIQHDCRNRFGGDPASDPEAGGPRVGPTGLLTFVRPA